MKIIVASVLLFVLSSCVSGGRIVYKAIISTNLETVERELRIGGDTIRFEEKVMTREKFYLIYRDGNGNLKHREVDAATYEAGDVGDYLTPGGSIRDE